MSAPQNIVVVGGGLAGGKAVEALRAAGFTGSLTLVGDEAHLPYERPPLSKSYLAGKSAFEDAVVHPREWYDEQHVDLRLHCHATSLDLAAHEVTLGDGARLPYDKLLLATGALPRRLDLPGAAAANVHYLRTREDSDAIRSIFGPGRRIAIVGGGWIGLEVAAAARDAGTEVTLVEMADLPLLGVLGPEVAQVFADLHRDHGVDLRLGATLEEITVDDNGTATGVRLGDGDTVPAVAVVVGVGILPNVALAGAAGLTLNNGVEVDAALRSSDPDVYAVGDIANHDHPVLGTRVRVEHWSTALNQPATAARAMLGEDVQYTNLPYFFSDQYDLGMEYVGYAPRGSYAQVVVRGDLGSREFVAFWLDGENRIKAAMNVNVWDVPDAVKPLIAEGRAVDPARLSDPAVAFADL
jgi:NADPH-dependent 2,4-dienoyl-CoA reductase/sulfur reductase-like enzyme